MASFITYAQYEKRSALYGENSWFWHKRNRRYTFKYTELDFNIDAQKQTHELIKVLHETKSPNFTLFWIYNRKSGAYRSCQHVVRFHNVSTAILYKLAGYVDKV